MTFIVAIIAIVLYILLSARLKTVEDEIKKLKSGTVALHQPQTSHAASSQAQVMTSAPVTLSEPVVVSQKKIIDEQAGGKVLAALGIIAVFLGLAFFLKYAFDTNLIGITGRIILGYCTGVLIVVLGISLRKRYTDYADTLTGGGIAVLYLTTFASYAFYHLFTSTAAYLILLVVTSAVVAMSVLLQSEGLVLLGILGAYITPMIMSIYKIDPFGLFTYLLIINIGNVAIAYWYKWTRLNLIGIIGTAALTCFWFTQGPVIDSDRVLVFLFSSIYFALYLVAGMMHHCLRKQISNQTDAIFATLNGLFYAGLGYSLLHPLFPSSMGVFMFVIALVYFTAALISYETNKADHLMNVVLPGLSALFLTIAIPIHFKGAFIPVMWVAEALCMFIIEYSMRGKNLYVYGVIVYVLGLLNLFTSHLTLKVSLVNFTPIINERFMLFAFAAVVAYVMAYIASIDSKRGPHETAPKVKVVMAVLAEVVGLSILTLETGSYFDKTGTRSIDTTNMKNTAVSIVWIVYATVLTIIGFIGRYRTLRLGGLILFFLTALKIFIDLWALGVLYRVVASIVFGVVALGASFAYSKFKDRLFVE